MVVRAELCPASFCMTAGCTPLAAARERGWEIDAVLRKSGCDCAILGGTELSVYRVLHSLPPYYIDAMEILAEQSILRCGKELRNV